MGKTTDLIYSFPRGLFLAQPGALKPSFNVVGYTPANANVETIDDATKLIAAEGKKRVYDVVVADDFSLLVEKTFSRYEAKMGGSSNGFKLWGALRDAIIEFRDTARACGMHVIMSAHESAPTTKDGRFIRGGPKLPGKMPEDFPGVCDIVLRTALDKTRLGWHGVYRCSIDDPNYVTKDRHGVTPDPAPMNLGEILRFAGYTIQRAPGLEWQEDVVEEVAGMLLEIPADAQFNTKAGKLATEAAKMMRDATDNDLHIRWALRDAFDRAVLYRARQGILSAFGVK
jgi:hypothetical protein